MAMGISGISNSGIKIVNTMTTGKTKSQLEKPTWDGKKAYKYIEDSNEAGLEYGAKATKYYTSKTAEDGEMSIEDLKKKAVAKEEKKKQAEKIEEKREEKRAEATKEMENLLSSDNHELDSYYSESDSGKTQDRLEALGHFDARV